MWKCFFFHKWSKWESITVELVDGTEVARQQR